MFADYTKVLFSPMETPLSIDLFGNIIQYFEKIFNAIFLKNHNY